MSQITIQDPKVTIRREWANVAPKVVTFAATGVTASGFVYVLGTLGVTVSPSLASVAVVIISAIAGYLKSDTTLLRGGGITQPAPVAAPVIVPVVPAPVATSVVTPPQVATAAVTPLAFDHLITPAAPVDQVTSV